MSIDIKDMTYSKWLIQTGNDSLLKKAQTPNLNERTPNGVTYKDANDMQNGKTIFQVANQNPTKETATAGGASTVGVGTQPSGMDMNDSIFNVPNDNNTTVLGASATGHTPQTQTPTLVSGLRAPQGNENTGSQGGATSDSYQLNLKLYAQFEAELREAMVADLSGEVTTGGEGTLSTGGTDGTTGAGGADGPSGTDGTNGVDGDVSTPPTDPTNPNDPANAPTNDSGNSENINDSSNDSSSSINRQEEKRLQEHEQELLLDPARFTKLQVA